MGGGLVILGLLLVAYLVGSVWSGKWDWPWGWAVRAWQEWADPDAARTARVVSVQRYYETI